MSSTGEEEELEENDVIKWDEKLEDHTLAVLEGDLEEDPKADIESFEGTEGVAKVNTEKYVTDFEEAFEFQGSTLEISVDRDGGLNTIEYWSDDPGVMAAFDEYLQDRIISEEQQPMLEPYKFEDVDSAEVAELVNVFDQEFEMEGPLPRGSNGQPRMHMLRVTDLNDDSEYKHNTNDENHVNPQDKIPGDAEYIIEGVDNPEDMVVEGVLQIRPQKHDLGLYTVTFNGEDAESQAYMVNTSLRAIDPDKDNGLV